MSIMSPRQEELLKKIESELKTVIPYDNENYKGLVDSMNYSLLAGGKRIRPMLVLEFCALCGGDYETALPFACAIEMIHTYSLIHDDLPCMDDDDLRRGKPTNHKAFGESTALLAGDGLLTYAFETMLSDKAAKAGADRALKAAYILARAAGYSGMIGGQFIDLDSENKKIPVELLKEMDNKKTGALIMAACTMGCTLAGADAAQINAAEEFAQKLGLAFQVRDDVLDVVSSTEELGKCVGSDVNNLKSTYVTEMGIDNAQKYAEALTDEAIRALDAFEDNNIKTDLVQLAQGLAGRTN